ncbi:pyridoxal phosphate-dependent aminotransferase [Symbiobacterium thermophilum]|uniref:Aminotransferase n=2 Tax=Symbiobacterium thermophilum TaxID=2734 RepID=Q67QM8_SYMTH|nr:pyridoxal phosphate-dependent aminotransferase [Symbiobacterium thermophilum]MBY6275543.1 pyridoxal phosphate-dependent aminotransferase [Symbiobacterium thermophilum]BAD40015.1 aspartate aminotransferase [Symbiobacterium thermophilum IAM 14863]
MRLSARARALTPSPTMAIDAMSKQMVAEGIDVVNFSVGEPDFDTPESIKAAGIAAIQQGETKYTPAAGTLELRKAICEKLERDNGLQYRPEEIVVSNGGKQSLYNAYQVLLDPGEEVIIQAPYWVSYPEIVRLAGGVPVVVETDESTGFRLTADMIREKLTNRTRVINLNSPSNPTGAVLSRRELEEIAALAVEHDLMIVTDEIYEKLLYDGAEHVSIASLGEEVKRRTITVNGLSKAYAMTGWRMGYTASERIYAKAMADLQSQSTSGPSSISQAAAVAALRGSQESVEQMRQEFDRRRRHMLERLNRLPGFSVKVAPAGAFYLFPNVSALFGETIAGRKITSSDDLAEVILEQAHVAVVPGTGFGAPHHIRFSYATSMERIDEGLDRIARLLARG